MTDESKKLCRRELALLARIRRCGAIYRESDNTECGLEGGGYVYSVLATGRRLPPKGTLALILGGYLAPADVGLFGEDTAQVFMARE